MFYEEESNLPEGWENSESAKRTAKLLDYINRHELFVHRALRTNNSIDQFRIFLKLVKSEDFVLICDTDIRCNPNPLSVSEEGEIAGIYKLKPSDFDTDEDIPPNFSSDRDFWLF